jgi:riboflavin kinase/FMN adenylyltransferase
MQIFRGAEPLPAALRGGAIAIGNFDGVHRGHQALIAAAREAPGQGAPVGVMTFDPHPQRFFAPARPHVTLTPPALKFELLARYGLDLVAVETFDAALAGLSADAFIADRLVRRLGVGHVVVGYDFRFGQGRRGTAETLRSAGLTHGFGVSIVEPVAIDGHLVSSTAIRVALADGRVDAAAQLLGHWWRIEGRVTGGARRGTGLGFPTANVTLDPDVRLGHGIYAARVYVGADMHAGAAYLGTRPTFDNGAPVLETFLLDFDGDLYGRTIQVEFIRRLRGDHAFPDGAALAAQMAADVAATRQLLVALEGHDPLRWPPRRSTATTGS